MNWIIRDTKKLYCHTDLNNLLNSWIDISKFEWVLSDLDVINFTKKKLPIDFNKSFSVITSDDFKKIIETDIQIVWGVISTINKSENPKIDKFNSPFVEGNDNVWINDNFQIENAIFEITAWDSSYTIIKFKDSELSKKFKLYFDEAIELDKYKF
ncbi:hypothetical protein FLCU109888_04465 [Flavobacterium cucumis]|uniref:Uncharacterized protein n=1 Tax=Flavobacterium cucumis TaxID=416016 RepID=A0A1M7ZSN2_9FLAO|nr:hypothetical protein [Flavobacterium cucumis]SHO71901.1 hypothetical protein SAMN05443547_0220 [Flavobacterium cucumis]